MEKVKKYHWLKLEENFFLQKEVKKLRRIAGGDTYTIIYLKMQLLSLKNEGCLYFIGLEGDFAGEIALEIDEDPDNVAVTLAFLQKYGLIKQTEVDEFCLTETIRLIGSETAVAERVRKHREKTKALQCNTGVTNCNTEIEIEQQQQSDQQLHKEQQQTPTVVAPAANADEGLDAGLAVASRVDRSTLDNLVDQFGAVMVNRQLQNMAKAKNVETPGAWLTDACKGSGYTGLADKQNAVDATKAAKVAANQALAAEMAAAVEANALQGAKILPGATADDYIRQLSAKFTIN